MVFCTSDLVINSVCSASELYMYHILYIIDTLNHTEKNTKWK